MRRLPVFFVLDCSESMVGENIHKMEEGLQTIVRELRSDPYALETAFISAIAFAGVAKIIAPLVEVFSFYPPKLPIGGGTNLGAALDLLMNEIDRSVVKTTSEKKGDWKPYIYLFTDGKPTDDPTQAIQRWKNEYASKSTLIAIGLGKGADYTVLKQLTEHTLVFEESSDGDYIKTLWGWVEDSVRSQSKSVSENIEKTSLPPLDESILTLVKEPMDVVDETCVTLTGRCQKTKKPYLIKYEREIQTLGLQEFKLDLASYHLTGCYPLEESYFQWTDSRKLQSSINTNSLIGSPGCPHCGNTTAFAVCGCGNLMCINGPETAVCPWCEQQVSFAPSSDVYEGFDVNRGRG